MKSLFQIIVLVVVFVISSGAAQDIGKIIPGTPTQQLYTFWENSKGLDAMELLDKLGSENGRLLMAHSNWVLLVYWPIGCVVTSVLARVLRVPVTLVLGIIALLLIIQRLFMVMNARYFEKFCSFVGRPTTDEGFPWGTIVSSFILCMALSAAITLYRRRATSISE